MKINRKKQLVIQNGKPPKVKSIAELFQDNVKLVLSSGRQVNAGAIA